VPRPKCLAGWTTIPPRLKAALLRDWLAQASSRDVARRLASWRPLDSLCSKCGVRSTRFAKSCNTTI
jgi:hypothetical protein